MNARGRASAVVPTSWRGVCLGLLASCVTVPTEPPEPNLPTSLEPFQGCSEPALDPDQVASVWQEVVEGRAPPKLPLAPMSDACRAEFFQPVVPYEACLEASPGRVWFMMPKVGTLEFVVETGRFFLTGPDDEKFDVDGYVVDRLMGVQSNIRIPKSTRDHSPRVYVPGFPEHVIDDTRAIAVKDQRLAVFDLRTRKELLVVSPVPLCDGLSVSGSEIVRDASAPFGVKYFGGHLFRFSGGIEAFALDERGRPLASTAGEVAAVKATDTELVLAAFGGTKLEVVRVSSRGVARLEVLLGEVPRPLPLVLNLATSNGVIAVGLGKRVVVVHPSAEPHQHELSSGLMRDQLEVLDGGKLVVATAGSVSWVFESERGKVLIDAARSQAQFVRRDGRPPSLALLADAQTDPKNAAVLVWADGRIERGPVGSTRIGRFDVLTYAGQPEPGKACAARVLSVMPELVRYRDWVLPATSVR